MIPRAGAWKVLRTSGPPLFVAAPLDKHKQKQLLRLLDALMRSKRTHRPFILSHLVTQRCDMRCPTCLWRDNTMPELTTEQVKKMYSDAGRAGFVALALWGGEPLLRDDIGDLVQHSKEAANLINIMVTSGYLLPQKLGEIGEYMDQIIVSLDHPEPAVHDKMRGISGTYQRVMESVKAIQRDYPQVVLTINCVVSKLNYGRTEEMIQLAHGLDVPISFCAMTEGRMTDSGPETVKAPLSQSEEEMTRTYSLILDYKKRGYKIFNSVKYLETFIGGKKASKCHYPKVYMIVGADGKVERCTNVDAPVADLKKVDIGQVVSSDEYKGFQAEAEKCWNCNAATSIDASYVWEDPALVLSAGGVGI